MRNLIHVKSIKHKSKLELIENGRSIRIITSYEIILNDDRVVQFRRIFENDGSYKNGFDNKVLEQDEMEEMIQVIDKNKALIKPSHNELLKKVNNIEFKKWIEM